MLALDAFHPNDNSESVSMGAEYLMNDQLAVRAGSQNLFLEDSEVGTTLGIGLKGAVDTYRYRVDYAWADQGRLGHSNRISVAMAF
jgi:long-subunit fatty acid transport protein